MLQIVLNICTSATTWEDFFSDVQHCLNLEPNLLSGVFECITGVAYLFLAEATIRCAGFFVVWVFSAVRSRKG